MAQTEEKWTKRDKKRHNKKHGMRIDGLSVKLLPIVIEQKAEKLRKGGK